MPVPGGFDSEGRLTTDPAEILASEQPLPVGYWKGSGLALVLDLLAATLSGGRSTVDIGQQREEFGLAQVFVAFDVAHRVGSHAACVVATVLDDLSRTPPIDPSAPIRHPGEQVLRARHENLRLGVPVDAGVWDVIRAL